jgi:hypothetical protein
MSRAYLRLDPAAFERKAIQQDYPPATFAAFIGVLCLAESQPERGKFRDERLLRALLGKLGRQVPDLIARGDLIRLGDGRLYLDGWDEWQEGDITVRDRVARVRARKRPPVTVPTVTPVTERTVYTPSEHSVIEAVGDCGDFGQAVNVDLNLHDHVGAGCDLGLASDSRGAKGNTLRQHVRV